MSPLREQCEELRLQWMKEHQKEVCKDRLAQLALKDKLREREKEEERMFAELWEEDWLAKGKREAAAMQKSAEQSCEVLKALDAQVAALSAHKEEAERLKEEEARWLVISVPSQSWSVCKVLLKIHLLNHEVIPWLVCLLSDSIST